MASVTGSRLTFVDVKGGNTVNVALTTDGTGVTPVAGDFNVEVFTASPSGGFSLASGFQASAYIDGAIGVSGTTDQIQAGTPASTEMLLDGSYQLVDQYGFENIQIVGSAAGDTVTGPSFDTVVGSGGDTITGSTNAGNSQLIDATETNSTLQTPGGQTIIGGAGPTTVWAGSGDSITGGSGTLYVDGVAGNGNTIRGGTFNMTAFNFGHGNVVTGVASGSASTHIDDSYGSGGNNSITGGTGALTFLKGAAGDTLQGGGGITGLTLMDGTAGNQSITGGTGFGTEVEGGVGDTIAGGTGLAILLDGTPGSETITGGSGSSSSTQVWGGSNDLIRGGGGLGMTVAGNGSSLTTTGETIIGGSGVLNAFDLGTGASVVGSTGSTTFINDAYANGGSNTLTGGAGSSTIVAGAGDVVNGGAGTLLARIENNLGGTDTVNLSSAAATIRDDSVSGTSGPSVTVTGFNTATDTIASATSVNSSNVFQGTSNVTGGNTVLTFLDGSTMTIIGVTTPISFTQ